jgi:hypothetical protein
MNDLSPTTRALLRAARGDAPNAAARAKIWTSVGGTGAAGGAAVGSAAAKAAALSGSAKLLVLGALFGSAITVGVATFAIRVGTPTLGPDPTYTIRSEGDAPSVAQASRGVVDAPTSPSTQDAPKPVASGAASSRPARAKRGETLEQEATLLAEARGALVRGDPDSALAALRAARALPARALEPEALALEARALRAEGHFAEADAAESRLRARFPDNGLVR